MFTTLWQTFHTKGCSPNELAEYILEELCHVSDTVLPLLYQPYGTRPTSKLSHIGTDNKEHDSLHHDFLCYTLQKRDPRVWLISNVTKLLQYQLYCETQTMTSND